MKKWVWLAFSVFKWATEWIEEMLLLLGWASPKQGHCHCCRHESIVVNGLWRGGWSLSQVSSTSIYVYVHCSRSIGNYSLLSHPGNWLRQVLHVMTSAVMSPARMSLTNCSFQPANSRPQLGALQAELWRPLSELWRSEEGGRKRLGKKVGYIDAPAYPIISFTCPSY